MQFIALFVDFDLLVYLHAILLRDFDLQASLSILGVKMPSPVGGSVF